MKKVDAFEDYFYLGKIIKTHGFDGKLTAYLDTDEPGFYEDLKLVFLNIAGTPTPHFIEHIKILNNKATLRFQDIHTLDSAEPLVNKEMYLPLSELPELSGNRFYYHEVVGYALVDEKRGQVGTIKQVLDYPNQAVFQVMKEDNEILIPVSEEVIINVDRIKKEILVKAPEGLIEIYL
jgi:16S rRNA processing protein RimM